MSYTCGWDGGGTHTRVLCLGVGGESLASGAFGPLNPNGASAERVGETVRAAVACMVGAPGGLDACMGLVVGMAGASSASAVRFATEAIRAAGYAGPLAIRGDHEAALAGAIEGSGAVLIAGTGAIAYARGADGALIRVGGYGHLIDDGGSGYAIGRDILAAAVRAEDGRGAPTRLTELLYARMGWHSAGELVTWLYALERGKGDIAALSALLPEALSMGDAAAQRIVESASGALSELALTAFRRLGLREGELALTGGVLCGIPAVRKGVAARCRGALPGVRVIAPRHAPDYGAALMAREKEVFSNG